MNKYGKSSKSVTLTEAVAALESVPGGPWTDLAAHPTPEVAWVAADELAAYIRPGCVGPELMEKSTTAQAVLRSWADQHSPDGVFGWAVVVHEPSGTTYDDPNDEGHR